MPPLPREEYYLYSDSIDYDENRQILSGIVTQTWAEQLRIIDLLSTNLEG